MTRPRDRKPSNPKSQYDRQTNEVGYGKPPVQHRFQRGTSGNPNGRPPGSKNESTILREIMTRKIDNRSGGRVRKITVLEGILLRIADDSLKGNTKSATFLLNRYAAMVSGELELNDISTDDREVLEAFARRLLAQPDNHGGKS